MEIYNIISKFFLDEASVQEVEYLNAWRQANESNEKEFRRLFESWHLTESKTDDDIIPDKEIVWKKILNGINRKEIVKQYSRPFFYKAIGIAATIALLIGISLPLLLTQRGESKYISFVVPGGQKAQVNLPDGTSVFLNSNSKLTYSTDYGISNRSVQLEGQAFFDVVKDRKRAFNVSVGGLKVVVHGTTFDVNAYTENKEVGVTLVSGSVSIRSASSNKILIKMKPNQKALISRLDENINSLQICDAEEESVWRYGKMKIVDENIRSIAHKMEHWYGVNISLENIDVNKHYWMTIKTESLREMLEIINHVSPIDYSINGEEVRIKCK